MLFGEPPSPQPRCPAGKSPARLRGVQELVPELPDASGAECLSSAVSLIDAAVALQEQKLNAKAATTCPAAHHLGWAHSGPGSRLPVAGAKAAVATAAVQKKEEEEKALAQAIELSMAKEKERQAAGPQPQPRPTPTQRGRRRRPSQSQPGPRPTPTQR